ncbi:inositol monophosphatase family protein [Klebsiella pneumoniae]|nr:inositol monophosphatase family protein [Klebsiella pneumoniae]
MGVGTSHRVTPADFLPFLQALLSDGGHVYPQRLRGVDERLGGGGRLIGYYEPHMNPWDALPGLVLMREAGGASNDFLAQEGIQRGNPLLLASQTLYPQLKKMIPQPLH